jgi:hypothetical protein
MCVWLGVMKGFCFVLRVAEDLPRSPRTNLAMQPDLTPVPHVFTAMLRAYRQQLQQPPPPDAPAQG